MLDVPNERSLHRKPTPRGGGIAIVLVTLLGLVLLAGARAIPSSIAWSIVPGGALVAGVGWLDDRRGVSARIRVLVHAVAALWTVGWIWGGDPAPLAILGGIGIVWAINLYNFMDGIDGLAAGEAVSVGAIAGVLLLATGQPALATAAFLIAAASLGFLGWNWAPARIFMGDAGSGFLGYSFTTLALLSHHADAVSLLLWMLLAGVFLFDATVTLLRRMARGERWYQAHRSHAYQRLVQAGMTHGRVTALALLVNLGLGLLAWLAQSGRLSTPVATLAGIVALTVVYLAIERIRPMYAAGSDPSLPRPGLQPRDDA